MPSKTRAHSRSTPAVIRRQWKKALPIFAVIPALAWCANDALAAQAPVNLGTASSFGILAGSAVTNTGSSVIDGDVGVGPGTAVTGFPPGTVNGATHSADAVAAQAESDLTTAYNDAQGRTPPVAVAGDLGGQTLTAGVYNSATSLGLTGTLTLDAQGDPNAVFIFQAGSTLTTASASDINLINGAQACNVYWQVGSSATLGTTSVFVGNILADTSITLNTDVTVAGRTLAENGAVTLDDDTVVPSACTTAPITSTTPTTTSTAPTTPTPTTAAGTPATSTPAGTGVAATTAPAGGAPATAAPGASTPGAASSATTGTGTKGTGAGGAGTQGTGTGTKGSGTKGTSAPSRKNGTAVLAASNRRLGPAQCLDGSFRVDVTGRFIRRVVFSLGTRRVATRGKSPFEASINAQGGIRTVTARVTFTDATRAKTRHMRFTECAAVAAKVPAPKVPVRAKPVPVKVVPVKLKLPSPSAQPISNSGFTG